MALTVSVSGRNVTGNQRHTWGTLAFDSSYPAGGEAFTPSQLELWKADAVQVMPKNGYVFEVDYTNKAVQAFYVDYTQTTTDGPLIEVPNAANLSSVTGVRWDAWGA